MSKYSNSDNSLMSGSIKALETRLAEVKADIFGYIESLDRPDNSKGMTHAASENVNLKEHIAPFLKDHGLVPAAGKGYDPNFNTKRNIEEALKEKITLIETIAQGQSIESGLASKLETSTSQYAGFKKTLKEGSSGIRSRRATTSAALEQVKRQTEVEVEKLLPEALAGLAKVDISLVTPIAGQKNHFSLPNDPTVPRSLLSLKLKGIITYERPEREAPIMVEVKDATRVVEAFNASKQQAPGI